MDRVGGAGISVLPFEPSASLATMLSLFVTPLLIQKIPWIVRFNSSPGPKRDPRTGGSSKVLISFFSVYGLSQNTTRFALPPCLRMPVSSSDVTVTAFACPLAAIGNSGRTQSRRRLMHTPTGPSLSPPFLVGVKPASSKSLLRILSPDWLPLWLWFLSFFQKPPFPPDPFNR